MREHGSWEWKLQCLLLSLVSAPRSLPAKSMKDILPTTNPSSVSPFDLAALRFKVNCRMQWLLEESALAPVQPVLLEAELRSSNSLMAGTCTCAHLKSHLQNTCLPETDWRWDSHINTFTHRVAWTCWWKLDLTKYDLSQPRAFKRRTTPSDRHWIACSFGVFLGIYLFCGKSTFSENWWPSDHQSSLVENMTFFVEANLITCLERIAL